MSLRFTAAAAMLAAVTLITPTAAHAAEPTATVEELAEAHAQTLTVPAATPAVAELRSMLETVQLEVVPPAIQPVEAGEAVITDSFGMREHPVFGGWRMHNGTDYAPGEGTPVRVAATGIVTGVVPFDAGGLGVHVTVEHPELGATTVYAHLGIGTVTVEPGQQVERGQSIGAVGNTGTSTGPHLHFEVHQHGAPVDGVQWLRDNGA